MQVGDREAGVEGDHPALTLGALWVSGQWAFQWVRPSPPAGVTRPPLAVEDGTVGGTPVSLLKGGLLALWFYFLSGPRLPFGPVGWRGDLDGLPFSVFV